MVELATPVVWPLLSVGSEREGGDLANGVRLEAERWAITGGFPSSWAVRGRILPPTSVPVSLRHFCICSGFQPGPSQSLGASGAWEKMELPPNSKDLLS